MLLKRKRSDSDISTSSSSIQSSPLSVNAMDTADACPSTSLFLKGTNAPYLSSRTRKRFRDNRPSEAKIHEHTLSMLYSAQKQQQQTLLTQIPQAPISIDQVTQQTSLHSFWSLPSRIPSHTSSEAGVSSSCITPIYQAANCEDCEAQIFSADGDAMDVDLDISAQRSALDYACSKCQKLVCHRCAISNLGADRRCLICAGKRTWVGGLGWMEQ